MILSNFSATRDAPPTRAPSISATQCRRPSLASARASTSTGKATSTGRGYQHSRFSHAPIHASCSISTWLRQTVLQSTATAHSQRCCERLTVGGNAAKAKRQEQRGGERPGQDMSLSTLSGATDPPYWMRTWPINPTTHESVNANPTTHPPPASARAPLTSATMRIGNAHDQRVLTQEACTGA